MKASKNSVLKRQLEREGVSIREYRLAMAPASRRYAPGTSRRPLDRHQPGKRVRGGRKGSKRGRIVHTFWDEES